MNSQVSAQQQILDDATNTLNTANKNLISHINKCKIRRTDGLIPNCCGDLIIFNQKAVDNRDKAQEELNILYSLPNK